MKLRNKKTGEIIELLGKPSFIKQAGDYMHSEVNIFNSLAELNEEWEDYEEPKEKYYYFISGRGVVEYEKDMDDGFDRDHKSFGNYFETKEEAEQVVEKLKAWKRLKDEGFEFNGWYGGSKDIAFSIPQEIIDGSTGKDLSLLFGGE